jgi:hypothetical protein
MSDKEEHLEFTQFKVQMIYGFITEPRKGSENWFEKFEKKVKSELNQATMRSGWTPMYRFKNQPTAVIQYRLPGNQHYRITPPSIWDCNGELSNISVEVKRWVSIRKDGAGALTLNFFVNRTDNVHSLNALLALLLLAPRTLFGIETSESSTEFNQKSELASLLPAVSFPPTAEQNSQPSIAVLEPSWLNFSSAFKLFVNGMSVFLKETENSLVWSELTEASNVSGDSIGTVPLYSDEVYDSDPQIPYMYVLADAPFNQYQEAFLEEGMDFNEKRKAREKYTKDIAAILGRWLIGENIGFASADYWEARGLIKERSFRSLYMNSLVFTTFSGVVTFSLRPDISDECKLPEKYDARDCRAMKLPFEPTSQSIIRCLEFSRMRWHHVLFLNRKLDNLIQEVVDGSATEKLSPKLARLMDLRRQAAIYLEDPFAYLWDATVGSELAKFLHTSIVEELEKSILRKLDMVKQLIEDRLEILKTKDFIDALRRTNQT